MYLRSEQVDDRVNILKVKELDNILKHELFKKCLLKEVTKENLTIKRRPLCKLLRQLSDVKSTFLYNRVELCEDLSLELLKLDILQATRIYYYYKETQKKNSYFITYLKQLQKINLNYFIARIIIKTNQRVTDNKLLTYCEGEDLINLKLDFTNITASKFFKRGILTKVTTFQQLEDYLQKNLPTYYSQLEDLYFLDN